MTLLRRAGWSLPALLVLVVTSGVFAGSADAPTVEARSATPALLLLPPDGADTYGRFSANTVPSQPSFFPIGVWSEQSQNALAMKALGITMFVTTYGAVADVRAAGLYDIEPLADEADMQYGPGTDQFNPGRTWPDSCTPRQDQGGQCGYTAMSGFVAANPAGTMRYTNYGKTVTYWATDAEAARFVNDYQDVVSADIYWATDPNVCAGGEGAWMVPGGVYGQTAPEADCRKPSNYGLTVDRVRSLESTPGRVPIWNFVELGHPGGEGGQMPVGAIRPAVWSSLIHGARGIVYFNHSFGGDCVTQSVLTSTCAATSAVAPTVRGIDTEITALAPVLNSPTVAAGVSSTGAVDQLTKWDHENFYVFTASTTTGAATDGAITIACVGDATATVLGENRTVPVDDGTIRDTWASGQTVHLYRIDGGSRCGLD